jgi:adenylate cyclase
VSAASIPRTARLFAKGLAFGVVVALAGAVAWIGSAEIEEDLGLRWLFALRGSMAPPDDVAIVAIDQESARALGASPAPREWPRELHARAVETLASAGARLIVFDLTFDSPGRNALEDARLAVAFRNAGNVVLVESVRRETVQLRDSIGRSIGTVVVDRAVPPIDPLRDAVKAVAPFPLPKAARVDAFWTFMTNGREKPTLPGVALHFHAHDAHAALGAIWQRISPPAPPELYEDATTLVDSDDKISAIRSGLLKDRATVHRIAAALENGPDAQLADRTRREVRALLDYYSGDETRYLNFYGPPRTIATLPYHALLGGAGDPKAALRERFAGKTVFVGFSAGAPSEQDRVRDDYHTVYTSGEGLYLSGVEIAATAFANLLDGTYLRAAAPPIQIGVTLAWGLLLGFVCRILRPIRALVFLAVVLPLYLLLSVAVFRFANLWVPTVVPLLLQPTLAIVGGVLLNHRDVRREREAIKRAFGYFLPNAVVDRLADQMGHVTATGQLVHGTCLATDAEQYTSLAEKMDPASLAAYMNKYYAKLFEAVARRGGIVSDVVGDAMIAIWAATSSDAVLRRQACVAALEMASAIDQFNVTSTRPLRTRIGLHSGQMLLGNVGAGEHYEYRAVGDIVNTASRIQGLNKQLGTCVLVSEAAVEGLSGLLVRPLGAFVLAGKSVPLRILELNGVERDPTPAETRIWEAFASALDAYRAGRLQHALRRFEQVLEEAPHDGPARFYLARCRRQATRTPTEPWVDVVHLDEK